MVFPLFSASWLLYPISIYTLIVANGFHAQSYCTIPNFRVLGVPTAGFLEVARPGDYSQPPVSGFLIELLDAMARIGKFTYTLTLTGDGEFGHQQANGCFDGAVGALAAQNVDIVAAALEETVPYQFAIDFTTPFLQSNVQLVYNTMTGLDGVHYAILADTATRDFFENSRNPRIARIWSKVLQYVPESLPSTFQEGLQLVMQGGWALVGRTPAIDNAVASSGGLLAKDSAVLRKVFAGFGVQQGSPLRIKLNILINQLQDDGTIDRLLAKYFPNSDFTC